MALPRKLTSKIYEIKAHAGKVTCLDLGETGRVLVTAGQDRNVNLWAIGEEECFMSLTGHNGSIECVRFAYNDDYVYSADDIGIIRRWDLNAQTICSTLNGHMKSVRTLDFNPSGEYVVSGSNDTTVRLWDVRSGNKCIKNYRGHVANVNSVKFSPDGLWIASAGTEGSIIIWDIRKSKQLIQFTERASPVTSIQFHPVECLLAAGRNDGSVYFYDMEKRKFLAKTDNTYPFSGETVKSVTFSERGECLFVGSAAGVSVIGWEPQKEFDHIASTWSTLGDLKIVNKKLICGSFENEIVSVHALSIDRVIPFHNFSNIPFSHSQSSRKSFTRGSQKLRLSIAANSNNLRPHEERSTESSPGDGGGNSSPNLSIEMVEDSEESVVKPQPEVSGGALTNNMPFEKYITPKKSSGLNPFSYPSNVTPTSLSYNALRDNGFAGGPQSLKLLGETDIYHRVNKLPDNINNDLGFSPSTQFVSNYEEPEVDFTVNSAQHPAYAPKMELGPPSKMPVISGSGGGGGNVGGKHKVSSQIQRRNIQTGTKLGLQKKLSNVQSFSTMDLHKIDDSMLSKKQSMTATRIKRQESLHQQNKENNMKNRNITVQILTKPPTRSRTSFDLRTPTNSSTTMSSSATTTTMVSRTTTLASTQIPGPSPRVVNHNYDIDDSSEIQMLTSHHEQIYQELCNRHATLQLIRSSTRSHDVAGALQQAIKISGRSVFVDLLGAILEKTSVWNLDMCLLLLPEIYELLQSDHKFHYTRACDTLRVIVSNFLPTIQDNVDSLSNTIGVDISREERRRKCIECQHWLLRIRCLSDDRHMGSALSQLQNLIINI